MKKILLICLIALVLPIISLADIPKTIHYQGRLTGLSGTPVDDAAYGISFQLWDAESGGTTVWTGSYTVETKNGYFNAELGAAPHPFSTDVTFNQACYLDFQISGDSAVMSPRIKLNSAAYAMNVADGAITADKISANAVNSGKITDGSITTQDLADGSINQAKAPSAVFAGIHNVMVDWGSIEFLGSEFSSALLAKTFNFSRPFTKTPLVVASHHGGDFDGTGIEMVKYVRGNLRTQGQVGVICNEKPTGGHVWVNWIAIGE